MIKIKRAGLILLPVAAFCIFGIFMLLERWKTDEAAARKTDPQAPREVSCLGRVVPGERVIKVTASSQSVVKELRVKRLDQVKKGQILAVLLDHDSAMASLRDAQAQVAVAESQLAKVMAGEKAGTVAAQAAVVARLESALKTARFNYQRHKVLFNNGAISRMQYEDFELVEEKACKSLEEAKATLASLKEIRPVDVGLRKKELAAAETGRDVAKAKLELCLVRSPIDGQVIEINTYPGESIGQAGVLSLADQMLMVDAEVYVTDIRKVRIGAKAVITGDGIEGEVEGIVVEVLKSVMDNGLFDPNPLAYSDKRVVKARIRVDKSGKIVSLINSQVFVRIFL